MPRFLSGTSSLLIDVPTSNVNEFHSCNDDDDENSVSTSTMTQRPTGTTAVATGVSNNATTTTTMMPELYRVVINGGAVIRKTDDLLSEVVGHVSKGTIITIVDKKFIVHPLATHIERLKLAGGCGWVSLRLNKPPPNNTLILEQITLDDIDNGKYDVNYSNNNGNGYDSHDYDDDDDDDQTIMSSATTPLPNVSNQSRKLASLPTSSSLHSRRRHTDFDSTLFGEISSFTNISGNQRLRRKERQVNALSQDDSNLDLEDDSAISACCFGDVMSTATARRDTTIATSSSCTSSSMSISNNNRNDQCFLLKRQLESKCKENEALREYIGKLRSFCNNLLDENKKNRRGSWNYNNTKCKACGLGGGGNRKGDKRNHSENNIISLSTIGPAKGEKHFFNRPIVNSNNNNGDDYDDDSQSTITNQDTATVSTSTGDQSSSTTADNIIDMLSSTTHSREKRIIINSHSDVVNNRITIPPSSCNYSKIDKVVEEDNEDVDEASVAVARSASFEEGDDGDDLSIFTMKKISSIPTIIEHQTQNQKEDESPELRPYSFKATRRRSLSDSFLDMDGVSTNDVTASSSLSIMHSNLVDVQLDEEVKEELPSQDNAIVVNDSNSDVGCNTGEEDEVDTENKMIEQNREHADQVSKNWWQKVFENKK